MTRLRALWRLLTRQTASDLDTPRIAGWIECPECGAQIPVGLGALTLWLDDDGQQVASVEIQTDDVWAHSWSHEKADDA